MPNPPQHRRCHDSSPLWPTAWIAAERFPAQPPHRGVRASPLLSWVELNRRPTRHPNIH
ncbi:hypothetical protein [Salinispora sp. H7-4]|uniref:hypothetical protein n=1 Tax=Salinispora sp. H7-4 TaxID=2748321 RepID=UPI0015D122C1|nr:hypothetical protein [Salinispora sp. H7-4]NYT93974.1 hypothetical protein [Salinispora sp. H7-4]